MTNKFDELWNSVDSGNSNVQQKSNSFTDMWNSVDKKQSFTDIWNSVDSEKIPSGNLATDIAKGVSRGWEYGMAGLGNFMVSSGEQLSKPFEGATYQDKTGKTWVRTATQQKVADALNWFGQFTKSYGGAVRDFYRDNASKGWEAPDPAIMFGWKHPIRKAVSLAAEAAPTLGIAAATTAATKNPMAGAATFFPQAYGDMYEEARNNGKSPEAAAKYALANAASQVGLETIPLGQWMRGGNIVKRMVRTAIAEGVVEEGTQQLVSNGLRAIGWKKPKDLNELKDVMLDGMAESVVAGTLMGGVLGSVNPPTMADRISDHVDRWAEQNGAKFARENKLSPDQAKQILEQTKNELTQQAERLSQQLTPPSQQAATPAPEAAAQPLQAQQGPVEVPVYQGGKLIVNGNESSQPLTAEAEKFGSQYLGNEHVKQQLMEAKKANSEKLMALLNSEQQGPEVEAQQRDLAMQGQFLSESIQAIDGKLSPKSVSQLKEKLQPPTEEPLASMEGSALASEVPPAVTPTEQATAPEGVPAEQFKMFEEVLQLKRDFAERIGERYVAPRSIGTYYPAEKSIRTRALNDLFTTAHEMFHYISDTNKVMKQLYTPLEGSKQGHPIYERRFKEIRNEIGKIYMELYGAPSASASMRVAMEEGGAMLVETYIKNPAFMEKTYPKAVKEFLKPGGEFYDPKVGEFVKRARDIHERYLKLDPLGRILSRVTNDDVSTDRGSFLTPRDRITENFFDSVYTAEKLGKQAGVHMTLKDPQIWFRLNSMMRHLAMNNVNGKGFWTMNLRTGTLENVSDRNWGDLINDLNKAGELDMFSGWLIARDQYFEYQKLDQLRDSALNAVGDKKAELIKEYQGQLMYLKRQNWDRKDIEAAYTEHREHFKKYGDEFNQFTRTGLKMLFEAGLLTPQQYAEMAVKESYAPMKRQIYDDILGPDSDRVGATIKVGTTKVSSMLRRTGGMQTIVNPLYQAVVDMGEIYSKSMKQRSVNSVLNLASNFPDLFHKLSLIKSVDEETGQVYYPQDKDPNIVMLRQGGKRVPYLVDQDIRKFIEEQLTPSQISVLEKVGNFAARLFTKGTTSMYPFFAFNNFVQDQLFALGNTRTNLVPVMDAAKLLHEALIRKDPEIAAMWERYHLLGGQYMTLMQNIRALTPDQFFDYVTKEKNIFEEVTDKVDKFMDIVALPVQSSEYLTRFVEFAKALKAGDSEIVALEKSGRVSGPFHHKGKWGGRGGRFLIDQIPYFNAGMQILGEQAESLTSEDPKRRQRAHLVALGIASTMIAAMINAYRGGSEEQKRLLRDLNAQEFSKYLFLPHPNGKELIRVRVPDMTGASAAMVNMMLIQALDEKSRYDVGDFANAATAFLPDQINPLSGTRLLFAWLPQIIKPSIELATNTRTFPNIRPIESQGMQYREPKYRAYPTTSQMAKDIGEKLNLSPIKIDYLIQGYLGRVTKIPTWVYEQARGGDAKFSFNPFVRHWYFESSQVLQEYYNRSREVNQKYNTVQHDRNAKVSSEERRNILLDHDKVLYIDRLMSDYSKRTRDLEIIHEDKLPPEKQRMIDAERTRILIAIEDLLNPQEGISK